MKVQGVEIAGYKNQEMSMRQDPKNKLGNRESRAINRSDLTQASSTSRERGSESLTGVEHRNGRLVTRHNDQPRLV